MNLRTALIYAGVAAGIAAIIQVVSVAQALALTPVIESPSHWAISAGAGIVSACALAALPYLKAVLPVPTAPPPVAPPVAPQGPTPPGAA